MSVEKLPKIEKRPGFVAFVDAIDRAKAVKPNEAFLGQVGKIYESLAEASYLLSQGPYLEMTESGYAPLSREEVELTISQRPDLRDPYQAVVKDERGKYHSYSYPQVPGFRDAFTSVAMEATEAIDLLGISHIKDKVWLKDLILTQSEPFIDGNFRIATETRLKLLHGAMKDAGKRMLWLDPYFGGLDRYQDPLGVHIGLEGHAVAINPGLTSEYNDLIRRAIFLTEGRSGLKGGLRVTVGDALWYAGPIADLMFSGETHPSEDDLRERYTDIFIFQNAYRLKFEKSIAPAIEKYLPDELLTSDGRLDTAWKSKAIKGGILILLMHELGHKRIKFKKETAGEIGHLYTPVKELWSEIMGHEEIMKLRQDGEIGPKRARWGLVNSLAWAQHDIEEYDTNKLPSQRPYAISANEMLGFYEEVGVIDRNSDNGVIKILDLDRFYNYSSELSNVIHFSIRRERKSPGLLSRILSTEDEDLKAANS